MPEDSGPRGHRDPRETPPPPPRVRPRVPPIALSLVVVGIMMGIVWLLFRAFPGAIQSGDRFYLFYSFGFLLFLALQTLRSGAVRWRQGLRHLAIWIGVISVLVLAVAFQPEIMTLARKVQVAFSGGYPVAAGRGELVVARDRDGVFSVMGQANDQPVRFMIDTGASETVLSPADAERLGVDLSGLKFDIPSETANGIGFGARYQLDRLSVGDVVFTKVDVMVNKAPMSGSLLGQTFLKRFRSVEVKGDRLYLRAGD